MAVSHQFSAIHFTPWVQLSGAQRSLLGLLKEQTKKQIAGIILLEENSIAIRARKLGARVAVINLKDFENFQGLEEDPVNYQSFQNLVLETKARILHCHSAFGMRYILKLARKSNIQIVCHQRDNYEEDDFHKDLKYADYIIAISESVFATLPLSLQKKATVIYNETGIPKKFLRSNANLRIGMAARSINEKGMHLFLDAVIPLMYMYEFEVWIWGLWSSRREFDISQAIIDRVNKLNAKFRCRIRLEPFRDDVEMFFRNVDIVVVPSLCPEPFGRVALESMAFGCLAIVAGHGGLVEIVDHKVNGLVFKPGDAHSLSCQIATAIKNEDLRSCLVRTGLDCIKTKFSSGEHYSNVQKVYEQLLSG
jgi:glycosyltransferase involved in cell wall biosynthesis